MTVGGPSGSVGTGRLGGRRAGSLRGGSGERLTSGCLPGSCCHPGSRGLRGACGSCPTGGRIGGAMASAACRGARSSSTGLTRRLLVPSLCQDSTMRPPRAYCPAPVHTHRASSARARLGVTERSHGEDDTNVSRVRRSGTERPVRTDRVPQRSSRVSRFGISVGRCGAVRVTIGPPFSGFARLGVLRPTGSRGDGVSLQVEARTYK
jgi:hypothetical protein